MFVLRPSKRELYWSAGGMSTHIYLRDGGEGDSFAHQLSKYKTLRENIYVYEAFEEHRPARVFIFIFLRAERTIKVHTVSSAVLTAVVVARIRVLYACICTFKVQGSSTVHDLCECFFLVYVDGQTILSSRQYRCTFFFLFRRSTGSSSSTAVRESGVFLCSVRGQMKCWHSRDFCALRGTYIYIYIHISVTPEYFLVFW